MTDLANDINSFITEHKGCLYIIRRFHKSALNQV